MGKLLKAECDECGFSDKTALGGTRANFQTNYYVPAIEKVTGKFTTENYKDKSLHDKYNFYSDDVLKHNDYIGRTHDSADLKLNYNSNFCPKCHGFTLSFAKTAIFD